MKYKKQPKNTSRGLAKRKIISRIGSLFPCLAIPIALPWASLEAKADSRNITAVAQVLNQSEPGSGFFVHIGNDTYFITARHVLGTSIKDVKIKLSNGESILVPFADQLPLGDLDAALIVVKQPPSSVVPLEANELNPSVDSPLVVMGYPISDSSIAVQLTERQGKYLGSPQAQLDQGYSLLYSAKTQVGFSGGPIIDSTGKVVGMHGRSESRVDSNGEHHRTGNALGIPMNTILGKLGAINSSGAIGSIDLNAAKAQAAQKSMDTIYTMLSNDNLSNQVLSEVGRAQEGGIPEYCIEGVKAYYYMYFSSLPDLAKAQQSITITKYNKNVPAAFYALSALVSKKMVNFDQALKYEKMASMAGGGELSTYTERRLKQEFLDFIKSCTSK